MRPQKLILSLLIVLILALLIAYPDVYALSALNALLIFCVKVLPVVFPFYFFSTLLTSIGAADTLSAYLKKPISFLYKAPPISSYIFCMSLLSGYPIGAKLITDFYQSGKMTSRECAKISTFCSTGGILFIVGTVGSNLFGSKQIGYIIFIAHIISALVNGLLYRFIKTEQKECLEIKTPSENALSASIISAIKSVLIVGGYVVIFGIIADMLSNIGVTEILTNIFGLFGIDKRISKATVLSLVEITRGVIELSTLKLPLPILIATACGAISFGGLSVTFQAITFLSSCNIKPVFYVFSKLTQAIIAFATSYLLSIIIL